ncbi:YtxH domain-containing protein [Bacillus xiapuensis]|uniref:YtxH domain-containing protein n=1 Tax=Bacillus xiapuensis TaxID=2014075 RepID=UPI000C245366|nr:YtxH domain-containing protein [Bacillus xiapuensis]
MESSAAHDQNQSKLMKGVIIGAAVGGALALLDSSTRSKVTETTKEMKDSTIHVVNRVKEDPSAVKNEWQERLQNAAAVLKEAIQDAQHLYKKVNRNVVGQVSQVTKESSEIVETAEEAAKELKGITSQVRKAGEEVRGDHSSDRQ